MNKTPQQDIFEKTSILHSLLFQTAVQFKENLIALALLV